MVTVNNVSTINLCKLSHLLYQTFYHLSKVWLLYLKIKQQSITSHCEKHKFYKSLSKFI